MENEVIEVFVKAPVQHTSGYALFVGNDNKTIIIYVDSSTGDAIRMIQSGVKKERPLTHDLMGFVFDGFGISVQKVLINDVVDRTFYARLTLEMKNELGVKIVEIDARPSDSITMALMTQTPIYIARHVFDSEEDMTEIMDKIINQQE
ncbi:MAG: bifunctional nuclease family protein [Opitutales bacterium]|nr:bifunctional nuclease family protein [Opitutales bacterium]